LDHAGHLVSAGRCWAQASRSATSPMPAAFATTLISRENFANGSVVRQVPTPEDMVAAQARGLEEQIVDAVPCAINGLHLCEAAIHE
jgi:hypothetical protein